MTTINQEVFSQITGFEGSWTYSSADQDGYGDESIEELISRAKGTYDCIDILVNDHESLTGDFNAEVVAQAVYDFVRLDTGLSADLDDIYIELGE